MSVTNWQQFELSEISGVSGQIQNLNTSVQNITSIINTGLEAATTLLDILINIAPGTTDPIALSLQASIAAVEKVLASFSFDTDLSTELLTIPVAKLNVSDTFSIIKSACNNVGLSSATTYGGIIGFANADMLQNILSVYTSINKLFDYKPQAGVSIPKPTNLAFDIVNNKPKLRWNNISELDLLTLKKKICSAVSGNLTGVYGIENEYIYREEGEPNKLLAGISDSLLIENRAYVPSVSYYLDNTAEVKKYSYCIAWDVITSDGEILQKIPSDILIINTPSEINKTRQNSNTTLPGFAGIDPNNILPGFSNIITDVTSVLDTLSGTATSVKSELQSLRDFLVAQTNYLNSIITSFNTQINSYLGILEGLGSAGLYISALYNTTGTSANLTSDLTSLENSLAVTGQYNTAFLLLGYSETAASVLSFVNIMKLLLGIKDSANDNSLSPVVRLAKNASRASQSLGNQISLSKPDTTTTSTARYIRFDEKLNPIT